MVHSCMLSFFVERKLYTLLLLYRVTQILERKIMMESDATIFVGLVRILMQYVSLKVLIKSRKLQYQYMKIKTDLMAYINIHSEIPFQVLEN